jgi:hypothetical protein
MEKLVRCQFFPNDKINAVPIKIPPGYLKSLQVVTENFMWKIK